MTDHSTLCLHKALSRFGCKTLERSLAEVEGILLNGGDPNKLVDGVSALHLAAGRCEELVGLLLKFGGDPNVMSEDQLTPLHVAASWGFLEVLQLLLSNGANGNILDQEGKTALDLAQEEGYEGCAAVLKYHSMLVTVEDNAVSPKYIVGRKSWFDKNPSPETIVPCDESTTYCHDNSIISPGGLSQAYTTRITQRLYQQLQEGKPPCLDVTSPDTPQLRHKQCHSPSIPCHSHGPVGPLGDYDCSPHLHVISSVSPPCGHQIISQSHHYLGQHVNVNNHLTRYPNTNLYHCQHPDIASEISSCRICHHSHALDVQNSQPLTYLQRHSPANSIPCSVSPRYGTKSLEKQAPYKAISPSCGHTNKPHISSTIKAKSPSSYTSPTFSNISNREHMPHRNPWLRSPTVSSMVRTLPESSNFEVDKGTSHFDVRKLVRQSANSPTENSPIKSPSKYFPPIEASTSAVDMEPDPLHVAQDGDISVTVDLVLHPSEKNDTFIVSQVPNESGPKMSSVDFRLNKIKQTSKDTNVSFSPPCPKATSSSHKIVPSQLSHKKLGLPYSNSQERAAMFVLSTDFSSEGQNSAVPSDSLTLSDTSSASLKDSTLLTDGSLTQQQDLLEENMENVKLIQDTSLETSTESFVTCENELNELTITSPKTRPCQSSEVAPVNTNIASTVSTKHTMVPPPSAGRWRPPLSVIKDNEDLMTSDESFAQRARSPRIYKMKMKCNKNTPNPPQSKETEGSNLQSSVKKVLTSKTESKENQDVKACVSKRMSDASDSLFSTISVRETVYKDPQRGVTLIERHVPSDCGSSVGRRSIDSLVSTATAASQSTVIYDWRTLQQVARANQARKTGHDINVISSTPRSSFSPVESMLAWCELSTIAREPCSEGEEKGSQESPESSQDVPSHLASLSNQQLSQRLQSFGEIPGPVVAATRQTYLRRLASLEANPGLVVMTKDCPDFPPELRSALNGQFAEAGMMAQLEQTLVQGFSTSTGRQWREGSVKSSFTYLLLDPRITDNLPIRARNMSDLEVFKTFICAIFYIGKGKRARPYCHLYEAVSKRTKNFKTGTSRKVAHILDIWDAGLGVVSLHCFQSVIPVEAYTREACMLEAIGLHKVTNMKRGDFYGAATTWSSQQRRRFGVYLLQKTLQIFLAEGERQISVPDLKSNSQ